MKKSLAIFLAAAMAIVLCAGTSFAAWPDKDITVISTHSAGGDTDYNARLLSRLLAKKLKVNVVVSNVTGSNGAIAMTQYKDAKPDGYTFVMTNTAALMGNEATGLADYGYTAFEPVCLYGKQSGENIVVPANSPYKTLKQLIDASKKKPNTIKFGISTGGGVYIASVVLKESGKAQFAAVEIGDAATRLAALLGGHIEATSLPYAMAGQYIEAGKIRSVATLLSDAPTLLKGKVVPARKTVPDLIINTLYVALAPKGTSPAVVKAMNAAIRDVVYKDPEYKKECRNYNLQDPWALDVTKTIKELKEQRALYMKFSKFLR